MKKSQTLATRALAFLKGGDEAKLSRFESKLGKYFVAQIAIRTAEIEKLTEKLDDLKEVIDEAIPNVNLDKISQSETLEAYIPQYVALLNVRLEEAEALEAQIEVQQAEVTRLNKIQTLIYGEEVA
jgi:hypothetical protein